MPRIPFMKASAKPPPFFATNERVGWPVALIMGLQHCLAMIGGIVSVPILLAGAFQARLTNAQQEYLIAAGLIVSGMTSLVQIFQFKFGNTGYFLGTGLISVMGTSFTFVPIATATFQFMMREDGPSACQSDADCTLAWAGQFGPLAGQSIPGVTNIGQCNTATGFCKFSGQEAYGAFLGTCAVCSLLEIFMSFMPKAMLKRAFPPMITGVCVFLIGAQLTGTGLKYWGGGVFCGDNYYKRARTTVGPSFPGDVTATYQPTSACANGGCAFGTPLGGSCQYTPATFNSATNTTRGDVTTCEAFFNSPGVFPPLPSPAASWTKCTNNGQVVLPFGSPEYLGLGVSVFVMLILIEMFGSPFMRNCEVVIALIFGYFVAGVSSYQPPGGGDRLWYVTPDRINAAPAITFLWVETFPLSIYAPAVIPTLIGFIVTTIETIGDISASSEASRVATSGDVFDGRVQGGLLADGLNSLFSCLATTPPNTTFSQNNGVIALTRCANKRVGYCCCLFLFVFGVLAKISAVIAVIPDCVLGGLTTFLFVSIVVGGVRILSTVEYTGRNRFIVASSLGLGLGNAIVPYWSSNALFEPTDDPLINLCQTTIIIIISTPYAIGTLLALFLHTILPSEAAEFEEEPEAIAKDQVLVIRGREIQGPLSEKQVANIFKILEGGHHVDEFGVHLDEDEDLTLARSDRAAFYQQQQHKEIPTPLGMDNGEPTPVPPYNNGGYPMQNQPPPMAYQMPQMGGVQRLPPGQPVMAPTMPYGY